MNLADTKRDLVKDSVKRALTVAYLYELFFHEEVPDGASLIYCPFHDHHRASPSFHLRREGLWWHCYSCLKGGDIISFTQQAHLRKTKRPLDFHTALACLAKIAGVNVESDADALQLWANTLRTGALSGAYQTKIQVRKWGEAELLPMSKALGMIATPEAFELRDWMWSHFDERVIVDPGTGFQAFVLSLKTLVLRWVDTHYTLQEFEAET